MADRPASACRIGRCLAAESAPLSFFTRSLAMYSATFIFAKKQYDDRFYRLDGEVYRTGCSTATGTRFE